MSKLVHVAAAVIKNSAGEIFIAKRPDDKHQGGLWEFPGGKVEPGEAVETALARELEEELGIQIKAATPLITIPYHYPDKSVLLDVFVVSKFDGEPFGREGQPVKWVSDDQLREHQFPAANKPIVTAAVLPDRIAITGSASSVEEYQSRLRKLLDDGVRYVMLRAPSLDEEKLEELYRALHPIAHSNGAVLALNTSLELANKLDAEALHLSSIRLSQLQSREQFKGRLLSASCHNQAELECAEAKALDFALLSPVAETSSHPETSPIGWQAFSETVLEIKMPVFALGGMRVSDIETAQSAGGQGVAAISEWWG